MSASTLYEPTGEVEDSLAVGIVPIAPTVDRGGIPGGWMWGCRYVSVTLWAGRG